MLRRSLWVWWTLVLAACGPKYFSGALDRGRIEAGEVYLDAVELPGQQLMFRATVAVDVPPDRVVNLLAELGAYPTWNTAIATVEVLRQDGDQADVAIVPNAPFPVPKVLQRFRLDRKRR